MTPESSHPSQVHLADRVADLLEADDVIGALELLAAEGDAPAQVDARAQLRAIRRTQRREYRRGLRAVGAVATIAAMRSAA